MYEYHEAHLKAAFPQEVRNAIRGMFDEAYTITNELIQREKWLTENPVARDIRPDILRAASARTAQLWCSKGILPFHCSFPTNSIKNCHHVELNGEDVILLLARVDAPSSIPPSSTFRDNIFDISIPLFSEYVIEKNPNIKQGFLATYGDRGQNEFQFGRVGIPGAKSWLAALPLERGPYGYISAKDHDEMLVELLDNARRVGEKSAGESED